MININIGVLGHVDSGKTSLCRCLSEILSTCALDKHKQSKERGITIDLGFSSFYIKKKISNASINSNEEEDSLKYNCKNKSINIDTNKNFQNEEIIQICLVDCPGHHSLLKCIVMGAEITDMIFLVIDVNKGIQKQTIECLVLCEIVKSDIIIILNKIDLIPINVREKKISLMKKKILDALSKTNIRNLNYYIISVAAEIKKNENINYENNSLYDEKKEDSTIEEKNMESFKREIIFSKCENDTTKCMDDNLNKNIDCSSIEKKKSYSYENEDITILKEEINKKTNKENDEKLSKCKRSLNINLLINLLTDVLKIPSRDISSYEEFYFLYDHSFEIKGKGTVYTGTVIKGMIKNNCNIMILPINEKGKVKEIQSFKKKVDEGKKGNRLSLLISNNNLKNTKKIERGIIVHEHSKISYFSIFICSVKLVEFYKKNINNGELLTCIIGFSSSLCYGYFFKKIENTYSNVKQLNNSTVSVKSELNETNVDCKNKNFDINGNYLLINEIDFLEQNNEKEQEIYFLVIMKKKIYCFKNEKCIFLKNDDNLNCRICLYGNILDIVDDNHCKSNSFSVNKKPDFNEYENYKNFKIMKEKEKIGLIEKVLDNYTLICKNIFNSSSQVSVYLNKKIYIVDSSYQTNKNELKILHVGHIMKPFAKNGKFVIQLDDDISYLKNNYKSFIVLIKYYKDIFTKKKIFF
ncbi:selenocysteine-specific elongation factor selB, putative [Plasmodium gallinaceum]|uniref:Selenocysteine-specific elongation factor selB, putative n=1 Tax=Plasmodium gallinaceum TaxID=5849 RepID=A0A1J1GM03_PLAGA|nr:selenocysteine-specific elongation factor selB, putative [Plasmodium gallinaceum]CRG93355.1 selenocysteine-specific elongation factor selB, putative [Plasmodium gallinaceum]